MSYYFTCLFLPLATREHKSIFIVAAILACALGFLPNIFSISTVDGSDISMHGESIYYHHNNDFWNFSKYVLLSNL